MEDVAKNKIKNPEKYAALPLEKILMRFPGR
jgi:hypothetical protein